MKKFVLVYVVLSVLSGCATISSSNEEYVVPDYESITVAKKDKKDITFSVSYYTQASDDSFVGKEKITEKVRQELKESGLFGKVAMNANDDDMGKLHYHFEIKVQDADYGTQVALGTLAGLSLTLIPVWVGTDIDATMFVFKNSKEVHSTSISTKETDVVWAPLLVLSPFLNHWTVGSYNNDKIMNYFMNDIIDNKLYK